MRRRYGGYSGYSGRKRAGNRRSVFLTILFWAVSGFIMIGLIHGGPPKIIEAKSEDVAKLYIGSIFPSVSRSADYESREAMGDKLNPAAEPPAGVLDEKQSETILKSMMGSMFPAAAVLDDDLAEEDPGIIFDTENEDSGAAEEGGAQDNADIPDSAEQAANIDQSKPVVIIYHTHATESYQPVTEGNFHALKEYGTVREVGNVLAKELEQSGIQVIHDKTIHDSPSYNQSYTRSLETIQNLMGSIESDRIILIDLHRDAAGYVGNVAKTVAIKKDTLAGYSLVIGTGNPNVDALRKFAGKINKTAEELYPGFGGRIIEKQYKFNQYVSDYHMLLEVGNNENTIGQAKLTGKYFARVLSEVINDLE